MSLKQHLKPLAGIAAVAGLALALTACGGNSGSAATTAAASGSSEDNVITVGASPSPHAEILNAVADELKVVEYNDYVQPNVALDAGDLDANYFQHLPYLENYNDENGTDLVSAGAVHFEPMGLYAGKSSDINNVPDGAKIAVPSDATNEARALLLLQDQGVIKLKDGVGLEATANDIEENPHNIQLVEVEAAAVPRSLEDSDFAVINGNYALSAGLDTSTTLASESADSEAAQTFANIIAVKEGNESSPKVLALIAALESQQVVDYINEKYDGSVVSTVDTPTDGFDATVDYDALAGETISIAASPTPHAEILEIVKSILAEKNITLDIQVYNDYVVPNTVVADGTVDANYFQHKPYLDDFNAENSTHIVSVAAIHVEPMGLYGGKQTTLDALSAK